MSASPYKTLALQPRFGHPENSVVKILDFPDPESWMDFVEAINILGGGNRRGLR